MQQNNYNDALGSRKKQRCFSFFMAAFGEEGMCPCVREHSSMMADGNRVRQPREDLDNVPQSSINLYGLFMLCKVIDDTDTGFLATHSTNLLLSQSLENDFNALSCVSTCGGKNQIDAG